MNAQILETALAAAMDRHLSGSDGRSPSNLSDSIRYSLLAPGKRIRPRLLLSCAKMLGLSESTALPPALALEMIHCFTLIHDDLPCMDNDDFRRGRPSNHKVYGEAIALLAGDGLIGLALDTFLDSAPHVAGDRLTRALKRFSWAMGPRGVIGGQADEALMSERSTLQDLERMHYQKTGALFVASLLIPMDLAGIASESAEGQAIDRFAHALGLAFQVADDLDDATESPELTSILYFMSPAQARDRSLDQLRSAMSALEKRWGDAASELLAISGEVVLSLEAARV